MSNQTTKVDIVYKIYSSFGNGDQAEIRRGNFTEPFWRIIDRVEETTNIGQKRAEKWKLLLRCLALSAGHDSSISFGKALANAGFSKIRFKRFLNCREDDLEDHLIRMARFLKSKEQKANWNKIYWLLFGNRDRANFEISRSYFPNIESSQ